MSLHIPGLYIAPSPRGGRGVFTAEAIDEGALIEICPVIVLNEQDLEKVHQTALHDYYFLWGDKGCAIALGYGSLYNHASDPNADYAMDFERETIDVVSIRPIAAGEEITFNYVDGGDQRTNLWFEEK